MRIGDKNGTVLGVPNLLYAKYILIHSESELHTNKLFEIVPFSAHLCTRKNLSGYPSNKSAENSPNANKHYLLVNLRPVDKDNPLFGKMFDVSKLEGYKKGHQSSKTFVTTVNELEKSIIS
jgi:hypothetical protein